MSRNLDIVSRAFLDNEYVVIAPSTHWAVGKPVSIQALGSEAFLLRELGSGSRHVIDQHMQALGMQLKVRLSLASNEAIRDLVASGMGLSVLSRHALGSDFERDGLAVLAVEGFPLKQAWHVVHLRSKSLSMPAQAFLDELLQTLPIGLADEVFPVECRFFHALYRKKRENQPRVSCFSSFSLIRPIMLVFTAATG